MIKGMASNQLHKSTKQLQPVAYSVVVCCHQYAVVICCHQFMNWWPQTIQ
jgi:hypothetical protein